MTSILTGMATTVLKGGTKKFGDVVAKQLEKGKNTFGDVAAEQLEKLKKKATEEA